MFSFVFKTIATTVIVYYMVEFLESKNKKEKLGKVGKILNAAKKRAKEYATAE